MGPPCDEITSEDKIRNYLGKCQSAVPSTSQAESSSTDEQTKYLISLTYDMFKYNNTNGEVVWPRVVSHLRSVEIDITAKKTKRKSRKLNSGRKIKRDTNSKKEAAKKILQSTLHYFFT